MAPLLDHDQLVHLRSRYDALAVDPDHGFFASSEHAEREVAREVDAEVKAALAPALARLLPGHQPFLGAFISKGPTGWNAVALHQDWTYTEEPEVRAVIVWCPLLDATPADGALHVVPGSHRWSTNLRGSGSVPPPLAEMSLLVREAHLRPLDLPAGTGVLYDAALLHGSPPNRGSEVRVAAAVALAPKGAQLVHLHAEPGGPVEGYLIDEAWYTTQAFGTRPKGYPRHDPSPHHLGTVPAGAVAGTSAP